MNNETLIIENSHLQGTRCRIGQGIVTFVFWCLWGYLLLPLISPIVDLAEIHITYYNKIDVELLIELFIMVSWLSAVIAISMTTWSFYNFLLHRYHKNKQWPLSIVMPPELARFFGVNTSELGVWQNSRELSIHLNKQGNIQNVNSKGRGNY